MSKPLLAARGLTATVDRQRLFDPLDLGVEAGGLVEVRGPNGSGKSTLLRCLAGLHPPSAGAVERDAALAYLGHRAGLCADLTPVENLRWLGTVDGARLGPEALALAMDRVELAAARFDRCGQLSAGQQRRAALARLLVLDAPVWLLDEPLTALDDAGCDMVRRLIREHRADGGAVVCATHGTLAADQAAPSRVVTLGARPR